MGDLLSILSQASTSLAAQRGAAQTASTNLENANTPGYSRQTAVIVDSLPADRLGGAYLGTGAVLSTVTQSRDQFVEAQLPAAIGAGAASTAESTALQAVTALDPQAPGGLAKALGNFYSGLRALAQNPGNASLRTAAVAASQALATSFNSAAGQISSARGGLDSQLSGALPEVNSLASQVAQLNQQIGIARASGGRPNDLLDARQKAQDRLVALTGARPVPNSRGDVNLALADGTALVQGNSAASLGAVTDPANGGHLALQITRTDGTGPTSVKVSSGTLGGLLSARDGALGAAANSLDQLASDLSAAANAVHAAGYALDGSTGRALFTTGAGSAAATLQVSAAIAANPSLFAAAGASTAAPGDAAALQLLVATESTPLSGGRSSTDAAAALTSSFGASQASAQAISEHDSAITGQLQNLRQSTSGVSIDEELVNLTQAQRGFQAVSKVITTANSLFDALLQMK